ncbi:phosphotransferase [Thermomicrobiaceae bacterium CFH 74404]|uniref:Phosphotransferase n=1 Tax=Thermalbibacter longus TaxID=2951981 RepID=A0AA41WAQ7_9BACT|nr:phosphotransferase [Thermalbibacter longus]MCM8747892.1 phosphotransferase [Thermalbibacter longus]
MLDRLTELAAESLRRDNPALEQVRIVGLEEMGGQPSYRQWSVRLTWLAGGMRYLDTFVARTVPGAADPSRLSELGHRLDATGIRVPALVGVSADPTQSLLLFETAPGQPAARVLAHTRLRWEISALAVTLARALASLHRLDWHSIAPWLADQDTPPEDVIDEQVDTLIEGLATRSERLPSSWREAVVRALAWLDLRRPVMSSLCLCHGGFSLDTVFLDHDEISGLYGWERAHVSDPATDLALLPYQARHLGLSPDDADLFLQTLLASYLQLSPHSLENLPFYVVAQLAALALDTADAALAWDSTATLEAATQVTEVLAALHRATQLADRAPWRSG